MLIICRRFQCNISEMVFFLILPISWSIQSGHHRHRVLIQQHFSLRLWETQPNLTRVRSENGCKDPSPSRALGEHVTVSTALPDFSSNICYLSSLSRPFLAYRHRTYCSLITARKPAVVCSHLKLGQFVWNIKLKRPVDHTVRFVFYFVFG